MNNNILIRLILLGSLKDTLIFGLILVFFLPELHLQFVQRRPIIFTVRPDVGPTLYKCYANVVRLLGIISHAVVMLFLWSYPRTVSFTMADVHDVSALGITL